MYILFRPPPKVILIKKNIFYWVQHFAWGHVVTPIPTFTRVIVWPSYNSPQQKVNMLLICPTCRYSLPASGVHCNTKS